MSIKELVKDNTARFIYYADGALWYEIAENDFKFPVPIDDAKGAVFNAEHKAITLMRWIRKHVDLIKTGEVA